MGYKRWSRIFGNSFADKGFALPTILISSIVMLSVLLVSVSSTTAVRTAILNQYYTQLAQVAGDAGVAYAQACLAQNGNVPLWTDEKPLTPATDCSGNSIATPTISVLVVAGGGGGGNNHGGGGGGGGVISSSNYEVSTGVGYTVTVGAGGSGGVATGGAGGNGGNSVFDTLTAIGGGGGGGRINTNSVSQAKVGGSGGGGAGTIDSATGQPGAGKAGTADQGYAGGNGTSNATAGNGGGGGGGGAVGGNASGSGDGVGTSGAGGNGFISSITGSSIYYAGGGSGGRWGTGLVGAAGLGGGGIGGAANGAVGASGQTNTGGGGGGGGGSVANGGAGGSGIVIVSYAKGSMTTTGGSCSDSEATGNTICTFTSSGTFTVDTAGFTCPGNPNCYVTSNGNVRSSFSVGLPSLDANGKATTISNTGYVEILRTSSLGVWRRYNQPSAQSAVVPDLCSGTATGTLGWNNAVKQSALASALVIGGGGGGGGAGSGGGAGGYMYNPNISIAVGAFPVTIGAGGAGGVGAAPGSKGQNSSFASIIAIGGGNGVSHGGGQGGDGGSGGGGSILTGGTAPLGGVASQGNNGGAGFIQGSWVGTSGGGGGAGAVGATASGVPGGGNGGIGLANSITGSAVYYAGGGGSGEINGSYVGAGGNGGGGSGTVNGGGTAGAANTGGGGGGGSYNGGYANGGAGGSGVVIISYPTGSITATGGTITASGGNTIHKFTSSGTFTVSSVQAVQSGWPGFPDNTALPIGISTDGVMPGPIYFRKDFSVIDAGTYNLSVLTGDNAQVYVDGGLVATSNDALASGSVSLSAGCHSITAKVVNGGIQSSGAYLMASLKKSDASLPLVISDTTWRVSAGSTKHYSQAGYYADPTMWTPVRDYQDATAVGSTWNSVSGVPARAISTTHSYSGANTYPATSYTHFRDPHTITVVSPTEVLITYICDDGCNIYLDGQVVASGVGAVATTTLTLTEGSHNFGMSGYNNVAGLGDYALAVKKISDSAALTFTHPGWLAANFWETTNNAAAYYSYDNNFNPNPTPVPSSVAKVLIVGGGGSGGSGTGGGGGGGGVIYNESMSVTIGTFPVTVGAGGTSPPIGSIGNSGTDSSFNGAVAIGGGGGGFSNSGGGIMAGKSGGSGGGGQNYNGNTIAGGGIMGQGFVGGPNAFASGAGGGGAGGTGLAATVTSGGGRGGNGLQYNISGAYVYYGGGGGGAISGAAGLGGATAGGEVVAPAPANLGGGGGGGWSHAGGRGGAGGSGIVIVSFPTGSMTALANGVACPISGSDTICTFTSSGTFTVVSIP